MDRRKFLVGVGSASIGGSALIGSGAFSRVEAQRAVSIQVAEDPDAYLGLDKCRYPDYEGEHVPNGSYAHLDDHGHLEVLMNDENPTIGESPLGEGINSDSRMWVDNVFQICNQGKEDVCVYIGDHEGWPRAPEQYDEERRVDFYLGGNREDSIVGEENEFLLSLGECVCIGLKTNSKGLSEGDELLDELDNEIRIVADVDGDCIEEPERPEEEPNGDEEEDDDEEEEEELFDAATISFLAFCADESVSGASSVEAIEWEDDDGERGDPVTVDWDTNGTEVNEIVLWTGQNTGFFLFENGGTSGIVTTRDDDDVPDHYMTADEVVDDDDTDRSQSEPCGDGDTSTKFEWEDGEFVEE